MKNPERSTSGRKPRYFSKKLYRCFHDAAAENEFLAERGKNMSQNVDVKVRRKK